MDAIPRTSRSLWWTIAVAGIGALVTAAVVALELVAPVSAVGVWLIVAGAVVLAASLRAPDGFRAALTFAGGAILAILLGIVSLLLPAGEAAAAIVAVGLWILILGAGCLAVSRVSVALHVPDGGLSLVAWAAILAGIVISTLPVFGRGWTTPAAAGALAVSGILAIVAAMRLRALPLEAPPVLSKREARRQQRQGRER